MEALRNVYDYVFVESTDKTLEGYMFHAHPWRLLLVILAYLVAIYVFLPKYMVNRKPYKLKQILATYNIFQIITCSILTYGIVTSGWTTYYSVMGCEKALNPKYKIGYRMPIYLYLTMYLKIVDFLETVFFVLRKKYNQVTALHVYHHISTLGLGWLGSTYHPGGMYSFSVACNCFVHVLMYTYYLFSSFGPLWQKRLNIVKSKLTTIQLVQLAIILVHTMQVLSSRCSVNQKVIGLFLIADMVILITMFMRFYRRSYNKKNI